MYIVHTRLYSFTTTLHFPSGQISLATLASLSSVQAPLLHSSLLPVISLFNGQTTQGQARLATSKLPVPQPQVYLIHIAATPAIRCCSITGASRAARPLVTVLVVLVRNGVLAVLVRKSSSMQ